jgi:hypothetical protein
MKENRREGRKEGRRENNLNSLRILPSCSPAPPSMVNKASFRWRMCAVSSAALRYNVPVNVSIP